MAVPCGCVHSTATPTTRTMKSSSCPRSGRPQRGTHILRRVRPRQPNAFGPKHSLCCTNHPRPVYTRPHLRTCKSYCTTWPRPPRLLACLSCPIAPPWFGRALDVSVARQLHVLVPLSGPLNEDRKRGHCNYWDAGTSTCACAAWRVAGGPSVSAGLSPSGQWRWRRAATASGSGRVFCRACLFGVCFGQRTRGCGTPPAGFL